MTRRGFNNTLFVPVAVAMLLLLLAVPQTARAHGELLIRIATVTGQIQAATNQSAQLYLQRGELYREDKNWDAAASDYSRAAALDPNLAAVDLCRAMMLSDGGDLGAARKLFDKVLARDPKDGKALVERARLFIKLGQPKLAVVDYEHGLAVLEPEPDYFLEWARTLEADARIAEALDSLDQGIKKFGPVSTLQMYAVDLELRRGNRDAAIARLDAIIQGAPRKENWLARRGDILLEAGRQAEARKSYAGALVAVKLLPLRLQHNPPMMNLQARVNAALAGLKNSPAFGKVD